MSTRTTLIVHAACGLLLGWLYGGDAIDAVRARSAEVSAFVEPPALGFAVVALVATLLAAGATAFGAAKKKEGSWRGYRLMPIVIVVALFIDLFVLSGSKSPLSSADRCALAVRSFADAASSQSGPAGVPTDVAALSALVEPFGPPPYLLAGVPAQAWKVVVRSDCTGPVTQTAGAAVGTIFYCVTADRKRAWVSAVSLPVGTYFGTPALFARGGEPVVSLVTAPVKDEEPEAPNEEPPDPPQERGGPGEMPDSGR